MFQIQYIFLIIIIYFFIGLALTAWDFRKSLFWFRQNQKVDYLEKPQFLDSLTIGAAILFIFTWPYKILR